MHTCPITLGHKATSSVFTKTTYIEEINKLENPCTPKKVYSRKHGRHTLVELLCSFVSIDQIEKREFTLFLAGNGYWGPIFGWSCNCKDFKDKLPSCKSCSNKLLKGENY